MPNELETLTAARKFHFSAMLAIVALMKGLHTLTFDPAEFTDTDRQVAWMRFFSKINPIVPLPQKVFLPRASIWIAERVTFTFAKSHPQYYQSDEAFGFNLDQRTMIMAWTCTRGNGQYFHDGRIFNICPGDVFFMDVSKRASAFMTDAEMYALIIPHASVGYDPNLHPTHCHFRAASETAGQFRDWILKTIANLPSAPRKEAPEIALNAKSKMRSLQDEAVRSSLEQVSEANRVMEFIDEHVFDPDLTLAALSEQFQLSKADLYGAAYFPNSLGEYIRNKRFEYAVRSLVFGAATETRVADIAALCGYTQTERFVERFEDTFGFAPDQVLGCLSPARLNDESIASGKLWDRWYSPSAWSSAD